MAMGSPTPPSQTSWDGSESFFMVAAIVAIALLLLLSNFVVFACCSPAHVVQAIRRFLQSCGVVAGGGPYAQLIPVSKYRKESEAAECSVCLSVFADGEDVRRMPVCEHLFHASCIDMWLCSHSDCPLCRASVLPPPESCPRAGSRQGSTRRQLLAESPGTAGVPFNLA